MMKSGRCHLEKVKEEEGGNGPPTFWKVLHGPVVIAADPVIISSDEEDN